MRPKTRDNLIYLAVGLGIAALLVLEIFYADSRGYKVWLPSKFTIRVVYTTALIWFVVIRLIRPAKRALGKVLLGILFATLLHLTIVFASRRVINELPGFAFAILIPFEIYVVVVLTEQAVPHLTRVWAGGQGGPDGKNWS